MSATFEDITRDSMQLPRNKRLELARLLLEFDDSPRDKKASNLWQSEIVKRAQAVQEGKTEGIPYEQVLDRVDALLNK